MLPAHDARCLILDEPTSALDIAHGVERLALMRKLSHEAGLGVIVVLHDVTLAARLCDRILALHTGWLIVQDEPGDAAAPDTLRSIYGIAMGGLPHPDTGASVELSSRKLNGHGSTAPDLIEHSRIL